MRVLVVGMGHVGAVTAACLAHDGHDVVCLDADPTRTQLVGRGLAPVDEPGLDVLFADHAASGKLSSASAYAPALRQAEIVIVAVGTPASTDGTPDLTQVLEAASAIGANLPPGPSPVVVLRSTVPPGTTEGCFTATIVGAAGGRFVPVVHLPEFFREGSAIADWRDGSLMVVGGSDAEALARIEALLAPIGATLHRTDTRTAEALKYACNAWHATKVAFANEVGRWAEAVGADPGELARLFLADGKLNLGQAYLQPGFAYGGPCLAKDLRALVSNAAGRRLQLPLLANTAASNEATLDWWIARIRATGASRIAVLGLVHRPGSRDLRVSPYVRLAERLAGEGVQIILYEPDLGHPPALSLPLAHDLVAAVGAADLILRSREEVASLEALRAFAPATPVMDLFRIDPPAERRSS